VKRLGDAADGLGWVVSRSPTGVRADAGRLRPA
jgi:hypothetical protein